MCVCVSLRKSVVPALFVLCPLLREPTAGCAISIQLSSPVTGCQASQISHRPHTRPRTCRKHCSLLKLKALASVQLLTRSCTAEGQIDTITQVMVKKNLTCLTWFSFKINIRIKCYKCYFCAIRILCHAIATHPEPRFLQRQTAASLKVPARQPKCLLWRSHLFIWLTGRSAQSVLSARYLFG